MGRVQEPPPPQEDLLDYDDELAEEVDPYPDDTLVTQSVPVAVVTRIPKVGPVGEQARDRDEILPLPPLVQPRYRLPPPPPPAPIWAPLCVIAASDALKEKIQALLVEEQGIYKGLQRVRSGFASAVECLTPWAQQLVEKRSGFFHVGGRGPLRGSSPAILGLYGSGFPAAVGVQTRGKFGSLFRRRGDC